MKPPSPGGRPHCGPGDGWVACRCGRRHWGLLGAAGLLVVRGNDRGAGAEVLLQHRAAWSDQGDTWGVPGGALRPGETAVAGALREAREEAGVAAESVVVRDEYVLTHPDWHYTTVLATASARIDPVATDAESVEMRWVPVADVPTLRLHPAFADAWPVLALRALAARSTSLRG